MKTYSFKAHEIGTEVWVKLYDNLVQKGEIINFTFQMWEGGNELFYEIGTKGGNLDERSTDVFLTKEEAEKSL